VALRRTEVEARWPLFLIVAAYLALAIGYGLLTPLNERYYVAYVPSVALDGSLPVQRVDAPGPWGNEGSQPPLCHLIAAAVSASTASPDSGTQIDITGTCTHAGSHRLHCLPAT
jgi:hypothetical protein